MKSSRLVRTDTLPSPQIFGPGALLVHDVRLTRRRPGFTAWARRFPAVYRVTAGEALKSVDAFPDHMRELIDRMSGFSRRESTLVCAGGGSVGDFGGFAASVLHRGVRLIHVPSTWLAAIDSAHGGKTALNVGGAKNQIGTFYPADAVYLVKELLFTQPGDRVVDGLAELVKMALLDGDAWAERLFRSHRTGSELVWAFLAPAIRAKLEVVREDPEERTGPRQILNFGHTLGHVLEAYHGLPHGKAVAQGLLFALDWSRAKVRLSAADHQIFRSHVTRLTGQRPAAERTPPIPRAAFRSLLGRDKKSRGRAEVSFVFLRGLGRPLRRPVSHLQVEAEAKARGWVS